MAQNYTVKAGDSLSLISQRIFGDFSQVDAIATLNKISNKDLIHPGQIILLPDLKSTFQDANVISSTTGSSSTNSTTTTTTKTQFGKYFGWGVVLVAAVLLGREAMKQNKKNKKSKVPAIA